MNENGSVTHAPNRGILRLQFPDRRAAEAARQAIEPDNLGHATCRVEGRTLVVEASAASMMGLLRSLDDVMGCLRATGLE